MSNVFGLTIHEDQFLPPYSGARPKVNGKTFPCMIERESEWAERMVNIIPEIHPPVHYIMVTGFPIIEAVCGGEVSAHWEEQSGISGA